MTSGPAVSAASAAPDARLGSAVARGSLVHGSVGLIDTVVQFLKALILARLVEPSDFGILGMALVAAQACEALSQTGLYPALVQKRDDIRDYLDTAWTVSVIRGLGICLVLCALSPLVGAFFATPQASPVLRCAALGFLLQGAINPAQVLLERNLSFARSQAPAVAGLFADALSSILLCLAWGSVWGMVVGFVLGRVVVLVASFLVFPRRPKVEIRWPLYKELRTYGRHISRATAVDYIALQLDRIVVGRLLGPASLGLYGFAARLAGLPAASAYKIVYGVMFPIFACVQQDPDRTRSGFLRAIGLMSAIALPMSAGIFAVSADLVRTVLGEKWTPMMPALSILCASGAFTALTQIMAVICRGIGRPQIGARGTYVQLAVLAIALYPATAAMGIRGAAAAMTASSLGTLVYLLRTASRATGCRARQVIGVMAPGALSSAVMAAALVMARSRFDVSSSAWLLAAECLIGAAVYLALLMALDRAMGTRILDSVRSLIKPRP